MLETFMKVSDVYMQIGESIPAPYIHKAFCLSFGILDYQTETGGFLLIFSVWTKPA